ERLSEAPEVRSRPAYERGQPGRFGLGGPRGRPRGAPHPAAPRRRSRAASDRRVPDPGGRRALQGTALSAPHRAVPGGPVLRRRWPWRRARAACRARRAPPYHGDTGDPGENTMTAIRRITDIPGPKSRAILERRAKAVTSALGKATDVVIDRAEGALVHDVDG